MSDKEIRQGYTVEAEPQPKDTSTTEWTAIREECVSGGQLTPDCNLVAAAHGAKLEVVAKRLSCGCWLVPGDAEEIVL